MRFTILATAAFFVAFAIAADAPAEKANLVNPLLVGSKIPDISLENQNGEAVSLHKLVAEQPTAFVFYRGGWCPYCMKQLKQLQTELSGMDLGDLRVVVVSQDSPNELKKTAKKQDINYLFLSDKDMAASNGFGISFRVDDQTVERYKGYGLDLVALYGRAQPQMTVPSVFMVDKNAAIRFSYVNPDYRERLAPSIMSAAYTAYFGE